MNSARESKVLLRDDNFGALRIIAALMVLIGHSIPLTSSNVSMPSLFGTPIHSFGLTLFFAISGYLVCGSALRLNVRPYLKKRFLRIYPAYALVILVWIFLFGPIFSNKGVKNYFNDPLVWQYLKNLIFFPVFYLPGNFSDAPVANAVNGSIWSLPIEIGCYAILIGTVAISGKNRIKLFRFTLAVLFGLIAWYYLAKSPHISMNHPDHVVWGTGLVTAAHIAPYFLFGAILRTLPGSYLRMDFSFLSIFALLLFPSTSFMYQILQWFFLPYLIVCFGKCSTKFFVRMQKFGDPSLGVYLWAFPVQQCVYQIFSPHLTFLENLVVVIFLSFLFGYLSWHLLEKHFLKRP